MNSPEADKVKKVLDNLPPFDVEKRLKAQDEMIEKLLKENKDLYMSLCTWQPLTFCVNCGHKVRLLRRLTYYTCDECKAILINY